MPFAAVRRKNKNAVKKTETSPPISREEAELIEYLYNYPTLEQLFDRSDTSRFNLMRQRMDATVRDLERVIRRGTAADAARATVAAEAFQTALKFLEELAAPRP